MNETKYNYIDTFKYPHRLCYLQKGFWRWKIITNVEVEVPFWDIAESLSETRGENYRYAQIALKELFADLVRLRDAGANHEQIRSCADRWNGIVYKLANSVLKHGLSGAERMQFALDSLEELEVIDKENGLINA